jgi:serine/threonine protein kinase
MGTAPYMSPEQVRGEKLDARSDLFSFGLVLYEMATGQVAFVGETVAEIHDAIVNRMPTPARELNADISFRLEEIINKALERDRDLRYQTAAEMRADLKEVSAGFVPAPRGHPKEVPLRWPLWLAAIWLDLQSGGSCGVMRQTDRSRSSAKSLPIHPKTT